MKWNGTEFRKEMLLKKSTQCFSLSLNGLEQVYESFFLHLMVRTKLKLFRTEIQAFLSSAEGLGTNLRSSKFFFSSTKWFWNDISSISIFCGMVQNRITKFWMFFPSTKWLGFEFRDFFAPAEWKSQHCPFRESDRVLTEWIKISVCSVFHGRIIFSRKWPP